MASSFTAQDASKDGERGVEEGEEEMMKRMNARE